MTEILLIVTLNTINQNQLVVAIEYELYKLIKYFEIPKAGQCRNTDIRNGRNLQQQFSSIDILTLYSVYFLATKKGVGRA
jgi:hypothetical protein